MNDDSDQPIFGVGRKSIGSRSSVAIAARSRKTNAPPGGDKNGDGGGSGPGSREGSSEPADMAPAGSTPTGPRKSIVGKIMSRLTGGAKKDKEPQSKVPITFEDTADLEAMKKYIEGGGDVNWIFQGSHPWAFLYGEQPTVLIAACFWKKSVTPDVVSFLLDSGADTSILTTMGFSAYAICTDEHPDWPASLRERMKIPS